ncbi:hypothetical protein V5799_011588 [Amblyomma americanum]|uniref:Secreted protein n=1 Tax=Amblyomma americanum TaxID=6943 RepID=A0AAQ4EGR6_AMBAM
MGANGFPRIAMSVLLVAAFVCLMVQHSLGMESVSKSKRDTIQDGWAPSCPTVGKPNKVCSLYVETRTCPELHCESKGKGCCSDHCNHLKCV